MNKKNEVLLAKRLLLGTTCETCRNRSSNYYCLYSDRVINEPVDKDSTCKEWEEYNDAFRPHISRAFYVE